MKLSVDQQWEQLRRAILSLGGMTLAAYLIATIFAGFGMPRLAAGMRDILLNVGIVFGCLFAVMLIGAGIVMIRHWFDGRSRSSSESPRSL